MAFHMSIDDQKAHDFVIRELKNPSFRSILMLHSKYDSRFKRASSILSLLSSSSSCPEFEVNCALSSIDPQEEFKQLLNCWIYDFYDFMIVKLRSFCSDNSIKYENMVSKVINDIRNINYKEYFSSHNDQTS